MEASPHAWAWRPLPGGLSPERAAGARKESEGGRVSAQFMLPRALLSPPSKTCAGPRKGVSGDRSVSGTRTQRGSRGTVEGACVPHTCVTRVSRTRVPLVSHARTCPTHVSHTCPAQVCPTHVSHAHTCPAHVPHTHPAMCAPRTRVSHSAPHTRVPRTHVSRTHVSHMCPTHTCPTHARVSHTCVAHMSHAHVAGQLSHRAREIFSKFLCSKATTPVNIDSQAQLADDILSAPHPDMFKEQQLQVTVHLAFPQGVLAWAGGPGGRGSCGGRSRLTHWAWVSGPGRRAEGPVGPWDASRPLHGPPQTAHPVTCAHAFAGTHRLAVGTQVYLEFF